MVLDINSGSVHVVDDLVYDVLEQLQPDPGISGEQVADALSEKYSPSSAKQ